MLRNRNHCSMKGLNTVWYENYCSATFLLQDLCISCLLFVKATMPNYLLNINNWTEFFIPWGVISSTDVTIVTSSLQNYHKMLEIEFSTKRTYLGFIIFQKLKKWQRLATYIWYDPRIYSFNRKCKQADKPQPGTMQTKHKLKISILYTEGK